MSSAIVPIPRVDASVRPATPDDVAFIDGLQREHGKQVGFLARSWIENKISAGQVLVAETQNAERKMQNEEGAGGVSPSFCVLRSEFRVSPVGYVISQDKYLKREELGLIVQLCVAKGVQRNLIGATLLRAAFDRAAYGCRLFCLWCAQDIAANRFWEAMGFVPLAYRAGSEKKRRVHIFWQKRVREGDDVTPWWFPSTTGAGSMNADRLVLPIPPGKSWDDELRLILPSDATPKQLVATTRKPQIKKPLVTPRRLFFTPPEPAKAEKKVREKKPKVKNDPKLVAAARELRDRWLEHVNGAGAAGQALLESSAKYDVTRALPVALSPSPLVSVSPDRLLPAA